MIKSYLPLAASRRYSADSSVAGGTSAIVASLAARWVPSASLERRVARRDDQHGAGSCVVERGISDVVLRESVAWDAVEPISEPRRERTDRPFGKWKYLGRRLTSRH